MAGRRTQRSATLHEPLALLKEMLPAREAVIRACAKVHPTGATYKALDVVIAAIDALALHLTEKDGHFRDGGHPTPGKRLSELGPRID